MSVIFKTKIDATINTNALNPSEAKALATTLELLNYQDTETYTRTKSSLTNQSTPPVFTNALAQKLYYHPEIYADQTQGLEFVASWFPLVNNAYYPDKKSSELLVTFLKFSLSLFTSNTITEQLKTRVFDVIKLLVHSPSAASVPLTQFLIDTVFDTRDSNSSAFIVQQCLKHDILNGLYYVCDKNQTYTAHYFTIQQSFVNHFQEGNWEALITKIHDIIPVGKTQKPGAYNLVAAWFSFDLAQFYATNLEFTTAALRAIKERFLFIEDHCTALLHIKTTEGLYPLIKTLGSKTWDSGDVLVFSTLDTNIPQSQVDACYLRFLDWLTVDGSSNFYTEAFKDHGNTILSNSNTATLPAECIPFWFEKCHPKTGVVSQTEAYNTLFYKLLIENTKHTLPTLRLDHSDFQITGEFLITTVFQIQHNLKAWLEPFKTSGIENPLNQFLVLAFYDAREALLTLYNEADCEVLQTYALALAHTATEASDTIKTNNLPLLVSILSTLCVQSGNYTRVNEIWALKNIDPVIKDQCNTFAQSHYINIETPLHLNVIQAWYNFLGDYYYSLTTEAVWVSNMLKTQGLRTGLYFNSLEDDTTFFLNKAINRIVHFHKKSKQKQVQNSVFTMIASQIETYLSDVLEILKKDKLDQNTVLFLQNYSCDETFGFKNNTTLSTIIQSCYSFHFKEAPTPEINILREHGQLSKIDTKDIPIDQTTITTVLHNLEHYKTEGVCETTLLQVLHTKIDALKSWLSQNDSGIETQYIQALYMTLLDPDLAPETPLETYGNLCRQLFVQLAKGSDMAMSYALGLKAMAHSGAYADPLKTTLLQVVTDLNT